MKVLHIFAQKVLNQQNKFMGGTKDIRCRTEYFFDRQIPFNECIIEERSDDILLKKLCGMPLEEYSTIFIENPIYPRALAYINQQLPKIKTIVRPINAEFVHNLHYIRAALHMGRGDRTGRFVKNAFQRLYQEIVSGYLADAVCPISPWETIHYWPYLAPKNKIYYLPYFLPNSYLENPSLVQKKKNQCICMLSTDFKDAFFVMDAAENFFREVNGLISDLPDWTFIISGKSKEGAFKLPSRVQDAGLLPSPLPLLAESRAMAILSNYGFGFKTKILEAIMAGCYILVPKKLHDRLPEEIKPFCLIVDKAPAGMTFGQALSACEKPFPENNVNNELRYKAYQVLDNLLGI
jgi:hypothetical protein